MTEAEVENKGMNNITSKKKYIDKYINILDIKNKYDLVKLLLFQNVKFIQTSNGIYVEYNLLADDIIDIVYNFIVTHI
jgi:hypothetical protein